MNDKNLLSQRNLSIVVPHASNGIWQIDLETATDSSVFYCTVEQDIFYPCGDPWQGKEAHGEHAMQIAALSDASCCQGCRLSKVSIPNKPHEQPR